MLLQKSLESLFNYFLEVKLKFALTLCNLIYLKLIKKIYSFDEISLSEDSVSFVLELFA